MIHRTVKLALLLVIVAVSAACLQAQKVNAGYDKSINFSRYRTYSVREPAAPPNRPLLYASVMGTVKQELEAKGYVNVEKGGDLTLIPAGGIGYDMPSTDGLLSDSCDNCKSPARDVWWPQYSAPAGGSSGKGLPKGTLQLTFVDTATKKLVWNGTVTRKLDPQKQEKSINQITAAVQKLLAEFPARK
jgi:hypothetical protein